MIIPIEDDPTNMARGRTGAVERVALAVEDDALWDLAERLAHARLADQIPGTGWEYGVDISYLSSLIDYWRDSYDWREAERELNALPHYRTVIDEQNFHFIHVRSVHRNATPLIMVHGWPGSVIEFLDAIGPLTDPEKYGLPIGAACHVVLPTLPGFGLSGPTRSRGWQTGRTGKAFGELMLRLGYSKYVVQGGDWGAMVVCEMARQLSEQVIGLHTNMPQAVRPPDEPPSTGREADEIAEMDRWLKEEGAYALLQGTKPQTIGVALNDSPVGLCAWIVEKFHSWSDQGLDRTINRDRMLTNIMLYWLTGTAASAARFYYEYFRKPNGEMDEEAFVRSRERITVPTAIARFPCEMRRPPRCWVEKRYNVVRWTEMPRGGHFAAMEEPAIFARDVAEFVASLQTAG